MNFVVFIVREMVKDVLDQLTFLLFPACMFLEDSAAGREVWPGACPSLLGKMAELFSSMLEQEAWRNGSLCYLAVKVTPLPSPVCLI